MWRILDRRPRPPLQVSELLDRARSVEVADPQVAALATADRRGHPSVRMIRLNGLDESGFVFGSDYDSRKARDLEANPWAALCFYTIAVADEQRHRRIRRSGLAALAAALLLDVAATTALMLGARGPLLTPHGLIGLSALLGMVALLVLARRHLRRSGQGPVPPALHAYVRVAYLWWLLSFASGMAA